MKKPSLSKGSKVIGYDMVTSCAILYGKDDTKRSYDIANFGTVKPATIKIVVLLGQVEELWRGHVDFIA